MNKLKIVLLFFINSVLLSFKKSKSALKFQQKFYTVLSIKNLMIKKITSWKTTECGYSLSIHIKKHLSGVDFF